MTTVVIFKSNGSYRGFTCTGHAGFAPLGKDIVCAAVSVLVINTINAIETLAGEKADVNTDDGIIKCRFSGKINDKTMLLMDAMELGLRDIERNYGKRNKKKYFELIIRETDFDFRNGGLLC